MSLHRYRKYLVSSFMGSLLLGLLSQPVLSAELDKTSTLWAPYVEWSFENPTYSGNPFDLIASATFTHIDSGETRETELFYSGSGTWKLRFTGTRPGEWTFATSSSDPDLNGKSGTIIVELNGDPSVKGFLTSYGNKFAIQSHDGKEEGYLFHVYMDEVDYRTNGRDDGYGISLIDWENREESMTRSYCQDAKNYGLDTVFIHINNEALALGHDKYSTHSSTNPDLRTFAILDRILTAAYADNCRVMFWMWGDEERKWTPVGLPGGINGAVDRRLQRYIAARLAPLPGWTMGYGFDLQEWVTESQVGSWAQYMHDHMGWPHLLSARGRSHPELDVLSYSGLNHSYTDAVKNLDADTTRPHLFGERDIYERSGNTMDVTRRHLWQYTLAGGHGGWWGRNWDGRNYPNPEQLRTFNQFWKTRFLLILTRVSGITDGYALKTADNTKFIFYKENTTSIPINLSGMSGAQPAIAVDTKKSYTEINLGILDPISQTWTAPYSSDWAIAIGDFGQGTNPPPDAAAPATPSSLEVRSQD